MLKPRNQKPRKHPRTVDDRAGQPAQIFQMDGNPAPRELTAFHTLTPDGKRLRVAISRATRRPHLGTIIALHGRNECIEKYFETMRDMNERGFDVLTFDWRGQGDSERLISDRMRGYVPRFTDYLTDLDHVFGTVALPDCRGPFFVVAHSTGALVALLAAPRLKNRVERMVLLAPFLGMSNQPASTRIVGMAASLLKWTGFGKTYMAGGPRPREIRPFEGNMLTTDPARYARNANLFQKYPHLALGGPTASWVAGAVKAMRTIIRRAEESRWRGVKPASRMPILILIAGADRIVNNATVERVARLMPGASALRVEHARHELLQERDAVREQVLAAIYAFIPGNGAAEATVADQAERSAKASA